MKYLNKQLGGRGQETAEQYLVGKGMELIMRNYSTRFGEIDLIMKDKNIMVFVEVKTKTGGDFGTPEEMFTRGKYERVRRMGITYLKGKEVACRIDMVGVVMDQAGQVADIRHYEAVTFDY